MPPPDDQLAEPTFDTTPDFADEPRPEDFGEEDGPLAFADPTPPPPVKAAARKTAARRAPAAARKTTTPAKPRTRTAAAKKPAGASATAAKATPAKAAAPRAKAKPKAPAAKRPAAETVVAPVIDPGETLQFEQLADTPTASPVVPEPAPTPKPNLFVPQIPTSAPPPSARPAAEQNSDQAKAPSEPFAWAPQDGPEPPSIRAARTRPVRRRVRLTRPALPGSRRTLAVAAIAVVCGAVGVLGHSPGGAVQAAAVQTPTATATATSSPKKTARPVKTRPSKARPSKTAAPVVSAPARRPRPTQTRKATPARAAKPAATTAPVVRSAPAPAVRYAAPPAPQINAFSSEFAP